MARRYTTLGEVVDQLKANNNTNMDINDGIAGIENQFGSFFAYLQKQQMKDLENSREQSKAKAAAGPSRSSARGGGGGLGLTGLGGILAGGGIGIGAAGAGLGAFFMGLAGAEGIMAKFGGGDNLKKLLTNLAEGLSAFSTRDLMALGAVLGAGALFGAVPGLTGIGAGIGVGVMGAGIAAFFSALAGGDMAIGAMEATGKNLSVFMQNFAEGLGALNNDELIAVGGLLATGAAFGALFGVGASAKAAVGITAIGAGIAGFFGALGVGDKLTQMMQVDGSSLAKLMKNVGEALGAFNVDSLKALGAAMAGGALLGLFGPVVAGSAALGIGLIGTGIGAFLAGLAGVAKLASWIGVDGSSLKGLLSNVAEGLMPFNKLEAGLFEKIKGIGLLGPALLAFFGSKGLLAVGDMVGKGLSKAINFIFGDGTIGGGKSQVQQMVDALKPLEDIKMETITILEKMSTAFEKLSTSLTSLGNINIKRFESGVTNIAKSLSVSYELLSLMAKGGTQKQGYFAKLIGPDPISFGPEGKGGILNPELRMDELVKQIGKVNYVLGRTNTPNVQPKEITSTTNTTGTAGGGANLNVIGSNNNTTNTSVSNNTSALISSGPAIDLKDQFSSKLQGIPAGGF